MNPILLPEATPQKLIDQFWETIPSTWNKVRSHLHGVAMEKFEVTQEQWHILRHIHKGINSVSELAQVKLITRSAMSQSVEVLVEKGLVERRQNAQDRRFVLLYLTERGDELVNTILQLNREWMMEKMTALTAEEIQTMIWGMQLLKEVFDQPEA
mgnify:CR=1 FL=1